MPPCAHTRHFSLSTALPRTASTTLAAAPQLRIRQRRRQQQRRELRQVVTHTHTTKACSTTTPDHALLFYQQIPDSRCRSTGGRYKHHTPPPFNQTLLHHLRAQGLGLQNLLCTVRSTSRNITCSHCDPFPHLYRVWVSRRQQKYNRLLAASDTREPILTDLVTVNAGASSRGTNSTGSFGQPRQDSTEFEPTHKACGHPPCTRKTSLLRSRICPRNQQAKLSSQSATQLLEKPTSLLADTARAPPALSKVHEPAPQLQP